MIYGGAVLYTRYSWQKLRFSASCCDKGLHCLAAIRLFILNEKGRCAL
jgi:hypothetical protein